MDRRETTDAQKDYVRERARGCCEYCRIHEFGDSFEMDHIRPWSRGGKTTLDNLAFACRGCNNYKNNRIEGEDPTTGEPVPLYHPRQQQWTEHFEWLEDFTRIGGRTPTGRATVETLRLNRTKRINQRRIFRMAGLHPPPEPDDE